MKRITFETLGNGAAAEKFAIEMERVLVNIQDVNTDPTAAREIRLVLKIKPDNQRQVAETEIHVTSKLAPETPHKMQLFFGRDGAAPVAYQSDQRQPGLFDEKEKPENVHEINKKGEEK